MANNEESYAAELAEDRAVTTKREMREGVRKRMEKARKTGKVGPAVAKNPLFKLLIPLGGEILVGVFPFWTLYIIYTFHEEKKAGLHPNIAEYMIIGGAAVIVDALDIIELTGVGIIIAKGIDIPTVLFLYMWRINKHGLASAMPSKKE